MIYIGIDPGFNGALAAYDETSKQVTIMDIPCDIINDKKEIDGTAIRQWLLWHGIIHIGHVVIEKAIVMPRQGAVSTSKFVGGQRFVSGILHGLGLSYEEVRPMAWKKALGLQGKDKEISIELAEVTFPGIDLKVGKKKSHDRAEAALLAWYAMEKVHGRL